MNQEKIRKKFEISFPCPEAAVYDESRGRYMPDFHNMDIENYPRVGYNCDIQNEHWKAYKQAWKDLSVPSCGDSADEKLLDELEREGW